MLVFISCAKTMAARCSVVVPEVTVPKFETEAVRNALEMSQYSVSELERLLRVNTKIAAENRLRSERFFSGGFSLCARTSAYHFFSLWVASPAGRYQTLSFGRRCPFARKRWNIHV